MGRPTSGLGAQRGSAEPVVRGSAAYLSARKEPGKTRERTVYTLTDKGLQALREYAGTPVEFTPLKSEPLLRLLICDLVGEDVTLESMATLRDDVVDISLRLDDAEQRATQLRHRQKYLMLTIGFMRQLLDLHLDLVEQVEQELRGETVTSAARSAD